MSVAFHIVIPSRLASTRLPRKPLADVAGKTLIERVWDCGLSAGAADIVVATDEDEIVDAVNAFGGRAVLTAASHPSGTDRLAEVVDAMDWPDDAIVVNLQGDEPCIPPALMVRLAEMLAARPDVGIATFATPIHTVDEFVDPSVVKVVRAGDGSAMYFSRAPIPYPRDAFAQGQPDRLPTGVPAFRHIGMYAYRAGTLRKFAAMAPSALESVERLEQLRALEAGIRIAVDIIDKAPGHGVDTPADLERVRAIFAQ